MPSYIVPREGKKATTYEARWGQNPQNGQPFSKTFKLRKEASSWLAKIGDKEYIPDRSSITIDEALTLWLKVAELTGIDGKDPVSRQTLDNYKKEVKRLRGLKLADGTAVATIKVSKLSEALLNTIRTRLLETTTRDQARRCFADLKGALAQAKRDGVIVSDPSVGLKGVKRSKKDKRKVMAPREHEMQLIWKTADSFLTDPDQRVAPCWRSHYRLLLDTMIFTGMRPSEVRGLARKDVIPERNIIQVRQKADKWGNLGSCKTEGAYRDLDVDEEFMDALVKHMATLPDDPEALLFATESGRPLSHPSISECMWYPLMRRAGLVKANGVTPRYPLYSIRHYYASMRIHMGDDIKTIQYLMGHATAEMTLDTYGHFFEQRNEQRAARARQFAQAIRGTGNGQHSAENPGNSGDSVVSGIFKRAKSIA